MAYQEKPFERWIYDNIRHRAEWNDWFAWHPIKIDSTRIWLKTVQRKLPSKPCPYYGTRYPIITSGEWQYRLRS